MQTIFQNIMSFKKIFNMLPVHLGIVIVFVIQILYISLGSCVCLFACLFWPGGSVFDQSQSNLV